ncbi:MAG: DUF58 domain-containing protein [Flavobacteriales bacterium]|nr:DUF58 domain-containing protein [Flavobacteriales bacterium]
MNIVINFYKQLQLTTRFFVAVGVAVLLFALSFVWEFLFPLGQIAVLLIAIALLADLLLLFHPSTRVLTRRAPGKLLSLGDDNSILLQLANRGAIRLFMDVYDELPQQFQERKFHQQLSLASGEEKIIRFNLRPLLRGEYLFGKTNVHITTIIGICARRLHIGEPQQVPVYPSILQMKKYELLAFASISTQQGIKRLRRLGHSYEFEQIKQYAQGDDRRSINWKATSRRHQLMVNQYEDERSQQVYTIIDKSRVMHMPFNGLSLLDYAINTSLVISNIALKKDDKVGYITYSHRIGSTIPAERSSGQLKKILAALYHERPQPFEANYDLLYRAVKNVIHARSLIFLYINFESAYAMERALPILQKINHLHLLVVMIFENTELITYAHRKAEYVSDIYSQTIAQKLVQEKKSIVSKLRKYGIQTILSKPEDLSINTVNKYLELKAKGMM